MINKHMNDVSMDGCGSTTIHNIRPVFRGRGTGKHMPRGVMSRRRQNILAKLILKIMYLMKKKIN
jgi:hypothetical protein